MASSIGVSVLSLPNLDANSYLSSDALAQEVIQGLKLAGACVIRHLYSQEIIDKLQEEVRPYISDVGNTTYFQKNVVTATGLAGKSETYALEVIGNPTWTKVRDHFLTYENGKFWVGDQQGTHQTSAQLGSATALELRPGAEAQGLHRDDLVHHGSNPEAEEYSLGRDRSLTFFVAADVTCRANGATRIVPGSHLWDYSRPPPSADDSSIVDAEINRGDALVILGSVIHGGGANTTESEHRCVFTCGASCSYLRQPENQYLANEANKIRRLPIDIQKFIGYSPFPPGVGLVNWQDPLLILNPDYTPELDTTAKA